MKACVGAVLLLFISCVRGVPTPTNRFSLDGNVNREGSARSIQWVPAVYNTGASFSAVSSGISYSQIGTFGTNAWSVCFWVKVPPAFGPSGRSVSFLNSRGACNAAVTFWDIGLTSSGEISLEVNQKSGSLPQVYLLAIGSTINDNIWHQVCASRSGGSYKLFLDGKTSKSGTSVYKMSDGTNRASIINFDQVNEVLSADGPCNGVSGAYGNFVLDEVNIWSNYALVLADATSLYLNALPAAPNPLRYDRSSQSVSWAQPEVHGFDSSVTYIVEAAGTDGTYSTVICEGVQYSCDTSGRVGNARVRTHTTVGWSSSGTTFVMSAPA